MLHVVSSKGLEVGLAIPQEAFDVVVCAFEILGFLHEQGFDVAHGWRVHCVKRA